MSHLRIIEARNVNDALEKAIRMLKMEGREEDSRNGPVIVMPGPVMTVYERPWERVLFSPARDANPFFHLYEAIWMLAGQNDVASVAHYAKRMNDYSDDGQVLHGAYGFRWREWFGFDQLEHIVKHLREQPNSRRAVLGMWSPSGDLVSSEGVGGIGMKDLPCNTHIYFRARGDALSMTVSSRSNDMVWGAYGANAVHFSVLHEYIARAVGLQQGPMYQMSNDFHIYKNLPQFAALWNGNPTRGNPYEHEQAIVLIKDGELAEWFLNDCELLMHYAPGPFKTSFFREVVQPMLAAHQRWKDGSGWRQELENAPPSDWRTAGWDWLKRKEGAA